ncbi:MAG: thiamine pyrophosphate-dependent dehydrogenase E1 component subunit alpha [Actinobacteria bacterium]|nr:thiamine pyrophosphate-dependent dehydrogenase E1 component subunit alpha [Actinomycetota bacterium]
MSMARMDPTDAAQAADVLKGMWSIRIFEEAVEELFSRGLLHGTMHLTIGQEAVAVGVCDALDEGDFITSTHRGHGHALAHGADPERMLAELLMKDTGYCRGRGGSMHIADVDSGNLGANGIVAGSMTIATGAALSQRLQETGKVVACFFGDGAANEGAFHEALNLASIWSLPVVFACENNQYGMSMAQEKSTAGGSVANRASAYGMPGVQVDGNDVVAVFEHSKEAVERARSGEGPSLLEFVTYRYRGHSKSDRNLYRTQQEIDEWRTTKDPLMLYEQRLRSLAWLGDGDIAAVQAAARERIRAAVAAAYKAPPALVDDLEGATYA